MAEATRFEEAFLERPVLRDLTLFTFLTVGFGIPFKLLFEFIAGEQILNYPQALGSGVRVAVLWIISMEAYARYKGSSIIRSFGEDPLEDER